MFVRKCCGHTFCQTKHLPHLVFCNSTWLINWLLDWLINWLINFRPMQSNLWLHSRHVRRIDHQIWRHHQHPPQARGWMVGGRMQQYHWHFSCYLCGDNLVIILWNIVRLNSSRIEILFRQLTKEGLFLSNSCYMQGYV